MPLGQLGKVEASKPWTKVHQQPWSDVFEGVEGGGRRVRALCLLAALDTSATAELDKAALTRAAVSPSALLLARPNGSKRPREATCREQRAAWSAG